MSQRNYEKNVLQRSKNNKICAKIDAKISHKEDQVGQMETDSTCLPSVHRQPASQQLMGCMTKQREGKSKENRQKAGCVYMKVNEKVWEEGERAVLKLANGYPWSAESWCILNKVVQRVISSS